MALTRSRGRSARASAPEPVTAGPDEDAADHDQAGPVVPADPAPLADTAPVEEITAAAQAWQAQADSVAGSMEADKAEAERVMTAVRAEADRIMAEATRKAGELAGWPSLERRRQQVSDVAGKARSLHRAAREQAEFLAAAGRIAGLANERHAAVERAAGLTAELAGLGGRRDEAQARRADAIASRDLEAVKAADADLAAGQAIAADCERERAAALARADAIYDEQNDSGELTGAVSQAQALQRSIREILNAVFPQRAEALQDAEKQRTRDAVAIVEEHMAALAEQAREQQRRPARARR